jgi:two-component sensor histidine kinase
MFEPQNQTNAQPASQDLVAEANHRFANHLTLLAGMVQMQMNATTRGPEKFTRAEVCTILETTAGRIVSLGNLHRRLASSPDQQVDIGNYLIENITALVGTFALGTKISIVQRLDKGCMVTPEQASTIALLVNEVMMNAVKHAHPAGLVTQLHLACGRDNDGALNIEIGDDGVGLPEGFDSRRDAGVGFKLIRSLASTLNASLMIESDSLGLTFRLRVPLAANDAGNVLAFQRSENGQT